MIIAYNRKSPSIGKNVFIAPTAVVIGDVTIGDNVSIWFNAVLRGDLAPIAIGANSNIQDNCTLHTDVGKPVVIKESVTVGHNAVVHGCTIERECMIGIGAIVLNDAHVLENSVVAAGAVVMEGSRVGPCQLMAGTPATVKKDLSALPRGRFERSAGEYLKLREAYLEQGIDSLAP